MAAFKREISQESAWQANLRGTEKQFGQTEETCSVFVVEQVAVKESVQPRVKGRIVTEADVNLQGY